MLLRDRIKKIARSFYRFVPSIAHKIIGKNTPLCRIEGINIPKKTIIIHCRGVGAVVKLSFDEIMNDAVILSNLSSKHASWVGYYYGKYYNSLISEKHKNNALSSFDFSMNNSPKKLTITMLNRQNDLICENTENNTTCIISPISAMANETIISQFDSLQACYIGILAGTLSAKKVNRNSLSNVQNAHLKLVK